MNTQPLNDYTTSWAGDYQNEVSKLKLFQKGGISWDLEKKQKFVKTFYHIRGHFYKFLWTLGVLATDTRFKKVILDNFEEEFGGGGPTHEKLYFDFAEYFEVDIKSEMVSEENNFEYIKKYNTGHILFLLKNNWNTKWGAFSAYEKLDNVDYTNLGLIAESMGANGKGMTFFRVHQDAGHYDMTSKLLEEIWDTDPQSVKAGFEFVAEHQLKMWRELDKELAGS